jgi:hypothetical protein
MAEQMVAPESSVVKLVAYPSQGHEMLLDAHTRSFTALGGIVSSPF